jgi:hypothetical protein
VLAHVERPDKSRIALSLAESEPGVFDTTTRANLSGLYPIRVVASGYSLRGLPFTREQLFTAAVFRGGDNPVTPGDLGDGHGQLCKLIECLLSERGVSQFLKERGIDTNTLLKCVEAFCRSGLPTEVTGSHTGVSLEKAGGKPTLSVDLELRWALEVLLRIMGQLGSQR